MLYSYIYIVMSINNTIKKKHIKYGNITIILHQTQYGSCVNENYSKKKHKKIIKKLVVYMR